jgi:two-component system OmpR family response regulator
VTETPLPGKVNEPALPGLDTVYAVNDKGWQQLQGSSTMLPGAALRFLVLVNGKQNLGQIAKHLTDVPEARLAKLALNLEQQGYIQQVKAGETGKAAAFDVLDFFSGKSVAAGAGAGAGGAQTDKEQARRLEAEAQSFTAQLKAQGYAVRIARQVGETLKPASGGAYSVLFVDDTPSLVSAVCKFLELEGFTPRRAGNRDEAVAELRKSPSPDLILLDVELPDISGFDILQRVRSHPALRHIPIVMITGKATREDVMRALATGANGYLTKPFEFESLLNSINAVLGLDLEPPPEEKAGAS